MAITLSCGDPAQATVGSYYEHALVPLGGTAFDYVYSIIGGSLPPGLLLNTGAGVIYGTPTTAGIYGFTVQVFDTGDSSTDFVSCSINVITSAQPLSVGCGSPPAGVLGQPYYHKFAINGGQAPFIIYATGGFFPSGLTVNNAGELTGTPQLSGTFFFSLNVQDAVGQTGSTACSITIAGPPSTLTLNCNNPVAGSVGQFYQHNFVAGGGVPPYLFQVGSGFLPTGLSLDGGTGYVGGVPTTAGTFNFSIKVTDNINADVVVFCSITIAASTPTLSLDCNQPPTALLGQPYSHTVLPSGGVPPFVFTVVAGELPPGLMLFASNGNINGAPSVAGSYAFTIRVVDAQNHAASVQCAITVNQDYLPLAISCNNPVPATQNVSYSHQFLTTGGRFPYTWVVALGALPAGLVLAQDTVTGTPTTPGTYPVVIRVTDTNNNTAQTNCTFVVVVSPGILLASCNSLPAATTGTPFTHTFAVSGGTAPYTWTHVGGVMPAGLVLSSSGVLSGTPTTHGSFPLAIKVADSLANEAQINCTLTINDSATLTVACNNPPTAVVGAVYNHVVTGAGGTGPYTFDISAGALPTGLNIATSLGVGVISGTPTFLGTYSFTVRVTDSLAATATVACSIVVASSTNLAIQCNNPPDAQVGSAYGHTFTASYGQTPYRFDISAGSLPAGLSLSTTGTVNGTPTTAGSVTFTVRVRDFYNSTATIACSINVAPPDTLQCNNPPAGKVGVPYVHQIHVPVGHTVTITSGALPAGLTMDANGRITGTPTTAGSFGFTITPS